MELVTRQTVPLNKHSVTLLSEDSSLMECYTLFTGK